MRRAYAFAEAAHRGQRRKDDRAFIAHPVHVARLLAARGYDEEVVAAALLHDVVEDTPVTLAEIRERFGARVAQLVECVTEDPELPTPERKRAYREGLRRSPDAARAICAADKVCNASDLYQAATPGRRAGPRALRRRPRRPGPAPQRRAHDARRVGHRSQPARRDARRARRAAHPGAPARRHAAPAPARRSY